MGLDIFLSQLLESGNVVVLPDALSDEDLAAGRVKLAEMDRLTRLELPGDPPPLDTDSAAWAAGVFYRLCQLLAYREMPAEAIKPLVEQPCPKPISPAVAYSVDLVFRYLPDLLSLASGLAPGDPLVEAIKTLCRRWPLSSVGVADLGQINVEAFIDNPSLRQLYVDRIMDRGDASRVNDPRVRAAMRASLGLYEDLCAPALAGALKESSS